MTTFATLQHASYTEAEWTAWNGILLKGQIAFSTDLLYSGTDQMKYKVGNGTDTWTNLDYVPEPGSATTIYLTARNTTGGTITKGQVVYINGATSSIPTIALARANAEATSFDVGVATFDIPNNTNVANNVTIIGTLSNVNTSAFTAGDKIYVSSTTAGALQNTSPSTPDFTSFVGHVLYSHASNGILLVAPAKVVISQNTSLGTSKIVAPSENAVKTYVDSKNDTFALPINSLSFNPVDATTYYWSPSALLSTTATVVDISLGYAFTVIGCVITVSGNAVSGTTEDSTFQIRNVTAGTSSSVGTFKTNGSTTTQTEVTYTGLNIAIGASDTFCFQMDAATFATNPTNMAIRGYLICKRT